MRSLLPWLLALGLAAGCGDDGPTAPPDLSAPVVDARPHDGVTITAGGKTTPLTAWYSIFIEPLEIPGVPYDVELVVTFIDPAFTCSAASAGDLDALSFAFMSRNAGATTERVFGRAGPHLGPLAFGVGYAELDAVDDRYQFWDAGVVAVGDGGRVAGDTHFAGPGVEIDGTFTATHCPLLDAVAAP